MLKRFADLFAAGTSTGATSRAQEAPAPPQRAAASASAERITRKELLTVVLRETLLRNGIPAPWIGAQFLRCVDRTATTQATGVHARLLVRHWHPRLPSCLWTLQRDFCRRVTLVDYRSADWLQGVSWQFQLPEGTELPPLPPASSWTTPAAPVGKEAS